MAIERKHIGWVDVARIAACAMVMVSHACDPFVGKLDTDRQEFVTVALAGSFVRPCVPLFIMISGVLLLPVKTDMRTFYARRMKRLLLPFVCWSLLLPVLFYLFIHSGAPIVNPNIVPADYTPARTWQKMYTFLFNFNYDTTALWYMYMLIGLYMFVPVISAWLVQASKKDIQLFLLFFICSACLPYVQWVAPLLGYAGNYGNAGLLGVCTWNPFGMLYYFSGFVGYIVLAYYLVHYPPQWSRGKTLGVAAALYLAGYAITAGGFLLVQKYTPGNFANFEVVWFFSGINVLMMTTGAFLFFSRLRCATSPRVSRIAAYTFGIYLVHFVFIEMGYDFIYPNMPLPPLLKVLLIAAFAFFTSMSIVWLFSKNKWTKKLVM